MRHCFNGAGYRVDLPPTIRGVNPHDDVTGRENAPERGEHGPAETGVTSGNGTGPGTSYHEGFLVWTDYKVFAIM